MFASLATLMTLSCLLPAAADEIVPLASLVGRSVPGQGLRLVSAMEMGAPVHPGGWHMNGCGYRRAEPPIQAKLGRDALLFFGNAEGESKGDFAVGQQIPGDTVALGCWVYLAAGANVKQVGFQIQDNEGESLVCLTAADWTGWKWIETPVTAEAFQQAYPQPDKNKRPDMPIQGVHIVWWSQHAGPSELAVDAVVAKVVRSAAPAVAAVRMEWLGPVDVHRHERYAGSVLLSNESAEAATVKIAAAFQRDGRLFHEPLPDPVDGTDHAYRAHSWTVIEGQTIEENSLTDGLDYTAACTEYKSGGAPPADQYVELDRARTITAMGWQSGDANWIDTVDVAASLDGKTFTPAPGLQGVEMYKKWGAQRFPAFPPFRAKRLRLHYPNRARKFAILRMPSELHVWDGTADNWELPRVGAELARVNLEKSMPAGSFAVVDFDFPPTLETGQYALCSKATIGERVYLSVRPILVEPAALEGVDEHSRFGLNAAIGSLAAEHRFLGIGWVRFENFKWPFVSPATHKYAFDGSTPPWLVDVDQIVKQYRDAGLNVLPMMFLTPQWASGAGDAVSPKMRLAQPPKDFADFGEFAFQSVARYGRKQVAAAQLKSNDRQTGLDRIRVFELGNEPDLNPLRDEKKPPAWGAWGGTMNQWWSMWRHGAEAVKQADPQARLSSPGFAGMTSEIVDQLCVHKYADGKCPLDFVDVLSVHFYSGRTPPEIARNDANNSQGYAITFIEQLKRLIEWRDARKPGLPIWMTETGYDTGGPIGTNEWTQAARLPRVVALCLANGVDKVFVYRESGSTPSQHAAAGVLRDDLSRKPSWYTYATLIRQLQQAQPGQRLPHPAENVWLQTWNRGGKTMLMAYCVTGQATLAIDLGAATVTDAFGGESHVDSTCDLQLSEFPLYISDMADESVLQPLVEQAQKREAARKQQRQGDARRLLYLFNFGDAPEPVATDIGRLRYYQPVPAGCLYEPKAGFGFVATAATRNDFRPWMPSKLEKYSVKFDKGQVFRCDVRPGSYELRIDAEPWGDSAGLILDGAEPGPIPLTFSKKDGQTITRRINVKGSFITLTGTYQHLLRWLVLEQTAAE